MKKLGIMIIISILCWLFCIGCQATINNEDADISSMVNEELNMEEQFTEELDNLSDLSNTLQSEEFHESEEFIITTIGHSDGSQITSLSIDPLWNEGTLVTHIEEGAEEYQTISFEGNEYTGIYYGTKTNLGCNYSVHRYKEKNGLCFFEINSKTGELMRIEINHPQMLEGSISEAEAKEIAYEFVTKYYNTENYECELRRGTYDEVRDEYFDSYIFGFYRIVNDIWIRCGFVIEVGIDGQVYIYSHFMNEEIDSYISQNGIEEFENTLNRLCSEDRIETALMEVTKGYDNYEVTLLSKSFALDETNSPVIILSIDITTRLKINEEDAVSGEQLYVILRDSR